MSEAESRPAVPDPAYPTEVEGEPYRPLGTLAKLICWAIGISLAGLVALLASTIHSVVLVNRLLAGEFIEQSTLTTSDNLVAGSALLAVIPYLFGFVAFIIWFRAAYRNLRVVDGEYRQRFRQGWAVGAWFVPIMNLFRPKEMLNDIANAIRRDRPDTKLTASGANLWWGLVIVAGIVGTRAFDSLNDGLALESLRNAYYRDIVWATVEIAAGVATIWLVRTVTREQSRVPATGTASTGTAG